jgi:hypothetical protein
MNHRVLTQEQIDEAKRLKEVKGFSKRKLAATFEVGPTTIYENVFTTKKRDRREYLKLYFRNHKRIKKICNPCARCHICLTREITSNNIPHGFQIGDICITCYLRPFGIRLLDLYAIE